MYQDAEETRSGGGLVPSCWHLDGIREASCPLLYHFDKDQWLFIHFILEGL